MTTGLALTLRVLFPPAERALALRQEARLGLSSTPKELSPKWLYDERGSMLFDEITRLPEYYLTRTEREILVRRAHEIADAGPFDTVIELGSGTSEKTRILLEALEPERFVPFDVSEEALWMGVPDLRRRHPHLAIEAIVGDFERHLEALPAGGRRLLVFLGSTIGNLPPTSRAMFLMDVAAALSPGDAFLLGADLVKAPARLEAAYDDAAGVTAAFTLNVLEVLNRELDADFEPRAFRHDSRWDPDAEWMDIAVRARRAQRVRLEALDMTIDISRNERLRIEVSAKFRPRGLRDELAAAGLEITRFWTDAAGDFGLLLASPAEHR